MDFYYRYPNGGYSQVSVTGNFGTVVPPEGAEEVTQVEYLAGTAAVGVIVEGHRAERATEEAAQKLADYTALTLLGLPVATALRMTGHVLDVLDND
ncbi:hypothetical protein [Streptomyces sp. NPDC057250]|uniref:hypothetical protein n=1 Tax=Streptomyces sp. NPDC057250 TaxID=3346068 RepID=UPI00362A4BFF